MIPLPSSFPSQNTHRVVVHQQTLPATDFERLEDLVADTIGAAREAVEQLDRLPYEMTKPMQRSVPFLKSMVSKRDVLAENFRNTAEAMLKDLARAEVPDEAAQAYDTTMRRLRDALNLSHRVADLLAAERDIFRYRDTAR